MPKYLHFFKKKDCVYREGKMALRLPILFLHSFSPNLPRLTNNFPLKLIACGVLYEVRFHPYTVD